MARIFLRGKMWYCDFWEKGGKRFQRPVSRNRIEAQRIANEMEVQRRMLKLGLVEKNMSLQAFIDRYLEFSHSEKALNTWIRDKKAFTELKESFPLIEKLADITPEFLQIVKIKWKNEGRPEATISRHMQSLKSAMKKSEEWKLTEKQNWSIVKTPKSKGRLIYYTPKEFCELIGKLKGDWLTAGLLMGLAGLRSGEVRHLQFEDIDWKRRVLHVVEKPCDLCPECKHRGNRWRPKGWRSPENNKARWVDMPKDLERHLRSLPKGQGWLLRHEVRNPQVYEVYFRRLIKEAGLEGSAHTLRHTYASHLVSKGVSLEIIGELLGHSDPKTTQIYAHLMPHARREAVDKLPSLVSVLSQ